MSRYFGRETAAGLYLYWHFQLGSTLLTGLLVLLAVGLLALDAAVLDEAAGRAVFELGVTPLLAAVRADVFGRYYGRSRGDAVHLVKPVCSSLVPLDLGRSL